MQIQQELVDEINVLLQFNLSSMQEGIKVHTNAEPAVIAATQRLYDKDLISQTDGGYLTGLGIEAAEHADKLLRILSKVVA